MPVIKPLLDPMTTFGRPVNEALHIGPVHGMHESPAPLAVALEQLEKQQADISRLVSTLAERLEPVLGNALAGTGSTVERELSEPSPDCAVVLRLRSIERGDDHIARALRVLIDRLQI